MNKVITVKNSSFIELPKLLENILYKEKKHPLPVQFEEIYGVQEET